MKPKQLTLDNNYLSSFNIRRDIYPQNHNSWHYHQQIEIVMINKGNGSVYIGDAIQEFSDGTCVIIGSNTPHFWLFHNISEDKLDPTIDCIVIHFNPAFAGPYFFNLPELAELNEFLVKSKKGILIDKEQTKNLTQLFNQSTLLVGTAKIISFLSILDQLSKKEFINIVSDNYAALNNSNDEQRMRSIMNYIKDNYTQKIDLDTLANEAKMTKNSFCRYFKQKNSKTPTQFINELRIAHSCRLLRNTKLTLKEICYDSGFNNFVSFHKIFKAQMNSTPLSFRKK